MSDHVYNVCMLGVSILPLPTVFIWILEMVEQFGIFLFLILYVIFANNLTQLKLNITFDKQLSLPGAVYLFHYSAKYERKNKNIPHCQVTSKNTVGKS